MLTSKIEPVVFDIGYTSITNVPVRSCYVKYSRIGIAYKLDIISNLLESLRDIIIEVENKKKISGVHNLIYSYLLERTSNQSRVVQGFGIREHGLYQLYNCLNMWNTFLQSHINGVYLEHESAVQIEKLSECNIRRIKYTVKKYDTHVQTVFLEQKKNNKHRLIRWIQKHTVGKGYVPVFIPIDLSALPIIKHKWDFS